MKFNACTSDSRVQFVAHLHFDRRGRMECDDHRFDIGALRDPGATDASVRGARGHIDSVRLDYHVEARCRTEGDGPREGHAGGRELHGRVQDG